MQNIIGMIATVAAIVFIGVIIRIISSKDENEPEIKSNDGPEQARKSFSDYIGYFIFPGIILFFTILIWLELQSPTTMTDEDYERAYESGKDPFADQSQQYGGR